MAIEPVQKLGTLGLIAAAVLAGIGFWRRKARKAYIRVIGTQY